MTAVPEDIRAVAMQALREAVTASRSKSADAGFDIIANAILAERERCASYVDWYLTQTSIGVGHIVGLVHDLRSAAAIRSPSQTGAQ